MQNQIKKRVCVIGAGLSGLVALKELRAVGIEAVCYEMMPILSGVFGSNTWKNGRLTSSTVNTFFSDFPVENRQHFFSWREFCDYLEHYADHFKIRQDIQLNTKVTAIEETEHGWTVETETGNFSNGHEFHPAVEVETTHATEHFTNLIVCTGLNQNPRYPEIPGMDSFTGQAIHSNDYRDAEHFRDQSVLIIGGGESGSDIAGQVAPLASSCTISLRSATGTLFPKWIQGNTPDIRDDRITYNLPRAFKSIVRRGHFRFYSIQKETPELFEWARQYNFSNNRCSFNSQACKSFGIPEAVVKHQANLKGSVTAIRGRTVYFEDGSDAEFDRIIYCTGFEPRFPFLPKTVLSKFSCVRHLWKNMIIPNMGDKIAFVGYARPHHINFLTASEMQARTIAAVLSGYRSLPGEAALTRLNQADRDFMDQHYAQRAIANPALVDHTYYTEGLAHFIGCNVPWKKVLMRQPRMLLKLVFSALHGAHHRLQGPGENWELASKTIMETPQFNNRRNAVFRWTMLSVFTAYSMTRSLFNSDYRLMSRVARQQAQDMLRNS